MFGNKADLNNINGVSFLTFPLLSDTGLVKHCFSTKVGGVSEGIYASMNLSLKLDDKRENVLENINRISKAAGFNEKRIVMSNQTHSARVINIDESHIGTGITLPGFSDDVDGMITNVCGITLMTFYADCVPVYFLDPVKKVIGLSHSGWRGTYDEISKVTVNEMGKCYGTLPEDVLAVTGPCICKSCYEVSLELGEKFAQKFGTDNKLIEFKNEKAYLDLSEIIRYTLVNCGVKEENISLSKVCTCCNSNLFHSHRATNGKRGLNGAMMCLKDNYE